MRPSIVCLLLFWPGFAIAQDQMIGPCSPDQIRATHHTGPAGGGLYIEVTLTNVSDATCVLAGAPRVVAMSSGGAEVPMEVRWPADGNDMEKGRESVAVNSKGQARFVIHVVDKTGVAETSCAESLGIYLPGSVPNGVLGSPSGRAIARIDAPSCRAIEVSGYRIIG